MAKWPARTWTPGETNLDTFMNDIRDELNELHGQVAPATTGKWNAVPFLASNFSVTSGGWTVVAADVFINKYAVVRKTVFWTLWITNTNNTVITGAPPNLQITPPLPFDANYYTTRLAYFYNAGTYLTDGYGYASGNKFVILSNASGTPYVAGQVAMGFTLIYGTP